MTGYLTSDSLIEDQDDCKTPQASRQTKTIKKTRQSKRVKKNENNKHKPKRKARKLEHDTSYDISVTGIDLINCTISRADNSSTPLSGTTRQPPKTPPVADGGDTEEASSFTLYRSLTEMLAPTPNGQANIDLSEAECTPDMPDIMNASMQHTRLIELEAQLMAAQLQLEDERDASSRFKSHIELLEGEIDTYKKSQVSNKNEIKKLMTTNDNLRRELSRVQGIRRFTDAQSHSTVPAPEDDICDSLRDELDITKVKLKSLKEHVMSITASMISALENEDGLGDTGEPFQVVTNERRTRTAKTRPQAGAKPPPAPSHQQQNQRGKPIEVVIDTRDTSQRNNTGSRALYSDVVTNRRRLTPDTVIIGTSLTRGVGSRLQQHGVDAVCFTYPGCELPHIRSRVPHVLPSNSKPKHVILQCGGNDLERQPADKVVHQYNCLVKEVRSRCPSAMITLSKIPPRRDNPATLNKIAMVNTYLENMGKRGNGVTCVEACPKAPHHFKSDKVHFNKEGTELYASNIVDHLGNFHWTGSLRRH